MVEAKEDAAANGKTEKGPAKPLVPVAEIKAEVEEKVKALMEAKTDVVEAGTKLEAGKADAKPEAGKADAAQAKAKSEAGKAGVKPEAEKGKGAETEVKAALRKGARAAKSRTGASPVKEEKAVKEIKTAEEIKAPSGRAVSPSGKETAKKEAVKKETVKKSRKTSTRTTSKKEAFKPELHFQFEGKDLDAKDVLDRAVKAFKHSHRGVEIKTMELYIVADESAAYYVVNGEAEDDFKLIL